MGSHRRYERILYCIAWWKCTITRFRIFFNLMGSTSIVTWVLSFGCLVYPHILGLRRSPRSNEMECTHGLNVPPSRTIPSIKATIFDATLRRVSKIFQSKATPKLTFPPTTQQYGAPPWFSQNLRNTCFEFPSVGRTKIVKHCQRLCMPYGALPDPRTYYGCK